MKLYKCIKCGGPLYDFPICMCKSCLAKLNKNIAKKWEAKK